MRQTFSIVVPVYQNEANLHETIPKLLDMRRRLPEYALELLFVDDGSADRSLEILTEYAAKAPETITVVKLTRNFGQTPAIQAGLQHARGDCVGIISADLQEPYELFIEMVREWENGAKFVIGERQQRQEGWWHRNVSSIYWILVRRFVFKDFPNMGYDFCLLDRQVVRNINAINEKNSSIFVLIYWLGYRPVRLPIIRKLREKGSSQWGIIKKVQFTLDTLIGFTYLPCRLITLTSMSVAFLAAVYFVFLLYYWQSSGAAPVGWMTVVGLLLLLGSSILFALGIVSEYLLRILDESRKRPPYAVEKVITQQQ